MEVWDLEYSQYWDVEFRAQAIMGYGTQIRAAFGVQDSAWVVLGWGKCISFLISHPPVRSVTPFLFHCWCI